MDTMSFIFRAYHAMARQRPMSTKKGVPTAATYVFVNMLRKLRADFNPEYLAAVFDVAGPTFRDEQAKAVTSVRKFDIKTQTFKEVEYLGYKAQRKEMPHDLVQQVPYIRRALEAYRIPILESQGFEADDVIGTLGRKAAAEGYQVFVVSSDKDMLQLVNDKVCVLNPPKDNLICDSAKVEEILGVRPEQVIDVMALRGDSIDNIPGAPGIGDKGSVEIIKRFGTLENALDHAEEVERKTYRESLLNNKKDILWSKQMVTIDQNVDIASGSGKDDRRRAGHGRAALALQRAGIHYAAQRAGAGDGGPRNRISRAEIGKRAEGAGQGKRPAGDCVRIHRRAKSRRRRDRKKAIRNPAICFLTGRHRRKPMRVRRSSWRSPPSRARRLLRSWAMMKFLRN